MAEMTVSKAAIEEVLVRGRLPCARAFRLAEEHKVAPIAVGQAASRLGIRISHCQLGLFGYDDLGERQIVDRFVPVDEVSDELKRAIDARQVDGKINCEAVWEIAAELALAKLRVAGVIEALGLKISRCQLGCFR